MSMCFHRVLKININIDEDVDGPVYVYYQLENFYQNHRRYVKSRSSDQLQGTAGISTNELKSDCDPLYQNGSLTLNPCGLIANSLFNGKYATVILLPSLCYFNNSFHYLDIIMLTTTNLNSGGNVSLDESGISWQSDRDVKFKNVEGFVVHQVDQTTYNNWASNQEGTCTDNNLESGKSLYRYQ